MSGSRASSESGSVDAELGASFLLALFGRPAAELVHDVAGRTIAVHHAPLDRLRAFLGRALVEDAAALRRLAVTYSQPIRLARRGGDGNLAYRALAGAELRTHLVETARWCIFDRLDGHFSDVLRALRGLCRGFACPLDGATSRGFFHTRGASVPRHCDELDAVVVQVFGCREWRLEPNSHPPIGVWDPVPVPAKDAFVWDAAFGGASRVVELQAGSVLYVPGPWWHQTRSRRPSFSITFGLPGSAADAEMRERFAP